MKLSDEELNDVTHSLGAAAPGGTVDERRRESRVAVRFAAEIVPCGAADGASEIPVPGGDDAGPRARRVVVRNLSPSGVGFLSMRPMSKGEHFVLGLPRPGSPRRWVLCTVRRVNNDPRGGGVVMIGATFARELSADGASGTSVALLEGAADAVTTDGMNHVEESFDAAHVRWVRERLSRVESEN